jgi:hypothetical protein
MTRRLLCCLTLAVLAVSVLSATEAPPPSAVETVQTLRVALGPGIMGTGGGVPILGPENKNASHPPKGDEPLSPVTPQPREAAPWGVDGLTVKIAVMGPGDELYFWWGHLAIVVEDAARGEKRLYDYGVFSFDSEDFFTNFAFGRMLYLVTESPADRVYRRYIADNRDITLYTLDLDADKKQYIYQFLEWNVRPENRAYWYHHFRDNCVTRVINILDEAIGGQFYSAFGDTPGRFTLRGHVRRHTWFSPFWDWLLCFLMGQDIDRPTTMREEMFLPSEVGRNIAGFTYIDDEGRDRKLVSAVEVLNKAVNRPPVLDAPRAQWPRELAVGLGIAAALIAVMRIRRGKPRLGRALWGMSNALLGLFFGIAGSLLFFLTFFTNHDYTWHNANVIFVNPLILAAVPLGLLAAFSRKPVKALFCEALLRGLWTFVLLGGIVTLLITFSPAYFQQNQVTLALVLPFAAVLSFVPDSIRGRKPLRGSR